MATPLTISDDDVAWIASHRLVVTVEDHSPASGLGATVAEALAERGASTRLVRHGVTAYLRSGAAADLYGIARLDEPGITASPARGALRALVIAGGLGAGDRRLLARR